LISINGEAIAHYEYDPFGRLVSSSGPQAAQNPWRFSTKQIEPQWSLYYYGYRYYSQNLGRWTSRDPIGDIDDSGAQAASPYLFVVNSPISKVDALGMQAMAVRIANISPGRCGGWGATTEHTASGTGYWVHRFYVKVPRRGVRRILAWQRCGCEEWTGPAVEEWFYEVFPAVNGEIVKDSSNEDRWSNCTMSLESGFKQKIAVFLPDTNAATDPHPAPFGPNVSARSRHAAKSLPPGWDQRIRNRIGAGLYWKVEFSWSWNCMDGRFDSETQVTGSASSGMPGARTPQK
jgi:RHS repeat-associated protein